MFDRQTLRVQAMQALYAFYSQQHNTTLASQSDQALKVLKNALSTEMERVRHLHIQYLHNLLFWVELDREYNKLPLRSLSQNQWITHLQADKTFLALTQQYPPSWPKKLLKLWYFDTIANHPWITTYKAIPTPSFHQDHAFIEGYFVNVVFPHPGIQAHVKSQCLDWPLEKKMLEEQLLSFIKKFNLSGEDCFSFYTHPFPNKQRFYKNLVKSVLRHSDDHEMKIKEKLSNWDINRLFLLDKILLHMGLAEAEQPLATPKQVVINEYIEIAKRYSAPDSHRFIHAMLDRIIPPPQ